VKVERGWNKPSLSVREALSRSKDQSPVSQAKGGISEALDGSPKGLMIDKRFLLATDRQEKAACMRVGEGLSEIGRLRGQGKVLKKLSLQSQRSTPSTDAVA